MANIVKNISNSTGHAEKQLGQSRPSDTTAVSLYSPASGIVSAEITSLFVANTTGSAATYRIFIDDDGTTYDQSTALAYDVSLAANTFTEILSGSKVFMNNASGNLAVRAGTGNALTFTVFGIETTGSLG